MIAEKTRVIVAVNSVEFQKQKIQRNFFLGQTGYIRKIYNNATYKYAIQFDDETVNSVNANQGGNLWAEEDLIVLEEDNEKYGGIWT